MPSMPSAPYDMGGALVGHDLLRVTDDQRLLA